MNIENIFDSQGFIFNPSICHYKDSYYIVTCREFVRYKDKIDRRINIYNNFQHPWYCSNRMWDYFWKTCTGVDRTLISVVKIEGEKIEPVLLHHQAIDGVDCRIVRDKFYQHDVFFVLTYNKFDNEKCYIASSRLKVWEKDGEIKLQLHHHKIPLALRISQQTEKNWALRCEADKITITYSLSPIVKEFDLSQYFEATNIKNTQSFFEWMEKEYPLKVSVSTPYIWFRDSYLGVGHMKYEYGKLITTHRYLYPFHHRLYKRTGKLHPRYVYMSFFYTIKDNKLDRASPFFIVIPNEYSLMFPSGLCWEENSKKKRIILSCGLYDSKAVLYFFTEEEVSYLLSIKNNPTFLLIKYVDNKIYII